MAEAQVLNGNVFACLVHERQESVVDLVRNLACLDPASRIVLYDGGRDPALLRRRFTVDGPEPLIHPSPTPLKWGTLHRFAIDCMRFALDEAPFDTLTIVDSDQLLMRKGYSEALAAFLSGREDVGMLGNSPAVQPMHTRVAPAVTAWQERALWAPYCRRFEGGEGKFPHWTFWPSTVFTAAACRDLVRAFDDDAELARTLARSRLWATEEILLPTLVALHGHEIVQSPFSYDLVRYNVLATPQQVMVALRRSDVFWLHPAPRRLDHPLRRTVREQHDHYRRVAPQPAPDVPLALTLPIVERMRSVEGWLEDAEADALIAGVSRALAELPPPHAVVEVGSHCGRSTVVLGGVVSAHGAEAHVHAIDPHDGFVGALDQGLVARGPTLDRFNRAIAAAGLSDVVTAHGGRSFETAWDRPIAFLLIDWLHDYPSVARDFRHFEPWLSPGAYVAFHDYAEYFPGVVRLVDELLASGGYDRVAVAGSLVLLRRRAVTIVSSTPAAARPEADAPALVSAIMATYGRPHLVPQAVASLLRQTHPAVELVVVDDGPESLAPLLPADDRVVHVRLERRQSIGAKRNIGIEAARGHLLANWDDDDWYAPWRIAYQVEQIGNADVCGLTRLLYLDPFSRRAWRYAWPPTARPWVHDAVLLYTRDFWSRNPFPDTNRGIDCRLLWTPTPKRIVALADETFYVGIVHGGNTSPKNTGNGLWSECPPDQLEALVGDDLSFFREAFCDHALARTAGGA
jgi:Methyltransferase domain/Glycosyl transferase family 2